MSDGKIPHLLTEEDIFRIKKQVQLREGCKDSWFTFIDEHPDFWTYEKLTDPYYEEKFDNVAKVTGFHGNNEYELVLDIDSDTVFELLKSPQSLENDEAREFVNRYSHLALGNVEYSSIIEFLFHITYMTMTRKKHGYHIHWVEHSQFKQIGSKSCIEGKEFEIFTKKHLVMLPQSRHRDDPKFRYYSIGDEKVQILDGLYALLVDLLSECLLKKEILLDESSPTVLSNTKETHSNRNLNEDQISRLTELINPFYVKGYRNKIILGFSGLLFKAEFVKESAKELTNRVTSRKNDEESSERISAVESTYNKGAREGPQLIVGVSLLRAVIIAQLQGLSDAGKVEEKVQSIVEQVYEILGVSSREIDREQRVQNILPDEVKRKLAKYIYKVTSFDFPIKLVLASSHFKNVILGVIYENKTTDEGTGKVVGVTYELKLGNIVIDAFPIQVIIYDNPIDKTRKYEITFILSSGKKHLVIGPASLEDIIAELQLRNKVLRKSSVHDAISAIISAYEDTETAIINDRITTPGFYMIDGLLISNETNQLPLLLPFLASTTSPSSNSYHISEGDFERIKTCIKVLEELYTKWRKGVFSTVIKWAIMAPLNYILKQNNHWIPFMYLFGWSNAGKTTLGKIVLCVWRKYNSKTRDEFLLGFASINSEARFGKVVSRDTYPRVINEVRSLSDPRYSNILEVMKNAVENSIARGRIENYRNYVNIPALSPLFLTGNYPPPENDTGFKRRLKSIHFDKNDSHENAASKEFEKWFEERKDILGILGDFAAKYLGEHLELLTDKNIDWEQKAKEVLKAFYQYASKEEPSWVNDTIEENTIEESKDEVTADLRSFFTNEINEYFIKYIKAIEYQNDEVVKALIKKQNYESTVFIDRSRFCIENKIIPYIGQYNSKNNESMICIMSPIIRELNKKKVGNGGLNTLRDIANEIPSFTYGTRVIGGKSVKCAYGSKTSFDEFITSEVKEE